MRLVDKCGQRLLLMSLAKLLSREDLSFRLGADLTGKVRELVTETMTAVTKAPAAALRDIQVHTDSQVRIALGPHAGKVELVKRAMLSRGQRLIACEER